jgi:hypothetical protein
METWLDLETRFRSLAPSLQFSRLDAQWGAAGVYWRIAGAGNSSAAQQFEILASIAGQQLGRALTAAGESDSKLLEIADLQHRWYNLLKDSSQEFGNLSYGQQLNDDGTSAGFIYTASLHPFSEASANLCLSLHASHPIKDVKSKWLWFHENYGKGLVIGCILAVVGAAAKFLFA